MWKPSWPVRSHLLSILLLAVVLTSTPWSLRAAELVMIESAACAWCRKWHAEIGPIYPKSAEATCAPLRRVDIANLETAGIVTASPVVYTPTFVIVEEGKEIGRVIGYAGEDFFWPLLQEQLAKLPRGCPQSS